MTIDELISKCKCGVHITVNGHRDCYETVEEYLCSFASEIDDATMRQMIEADTIVELQFFPRTPVGSYSVWGTSLAEVLTAADSCFEVTP